MVAMYFRTKIIEGSPVVQLVESFRNAEGKPRQRVMASLGGAIIPEDEKRPIIRAVENYFSGYQDLLPEKLSAVAASFVTRILQNMSSSKSAPRVTSAKVDGVLIDHVATENIVELGPQLVALKAWKELELSEILQKAGLNPSQIATAQLMVANRLIEPLSEWALIDWSTRTALPEILKIRITKSTKDRLYLTSDVLYAHRKMIEENLRRRQIDIFSLKRSIILYDLTNTHFEGICKQNPKALHGKNKQKRNDCRQVAIGMAFDEHGLPLAHDVFEGNIAESKTLALMLDRLEMPDKGAKPVVILDAGFASAANIALLKERGLSYLINITRGSRTKYAASFAEGGFKLIPGRTAEERIEVKTIVDPDDKEARLVLCRSVQRREKETAMLSQAESRFLADVTALRKRITEGRLKNPAAIERSIGRIQKKHPRVTRFYALQYQKGILNATLLEDKRHLAEELCGDYVLKTDQSLDAEKVWSLYMTLLQAEEGFSCLKGTLGLRPNFHQLEHRVEGHIFISVLAYHLLVWVRQTLRHSDDLRDWKTLRRVLSTHCLTTISMLLENGQVVKIRKPSVPDAEQSRIYDLLQIKWKAAFPPVKTFVKA